MKIDAKFFQKSHQRSVDLDTNSYTEDDIASMEREGIIYYQNSDKNFPKVALEDVDKIKVVVNDYGCLAVMATMDDSFDFKRIYIKFN